MKFTGLRRRGFSVRKPSFGLVVLGQRRVSVREIGAHAGLLCALTEEDKADTDPFRHRGLPFPTTLSMPSARMVAAAWASALDLRCLSQAPCRAGTAGSRGAANGQPCPAREKVTLPFFWAWVTRCQNRDIRARLLSSVPTIDRPNDLADDDPARVNHQRSQRVHHVPDLAC